MSARILCTLIWAVSAAAAFGAPPSNADDATANANESVLRDYYSGNGLLNRGLYDLAAAEYRKFLDQHPDHAKAPTARYGLAVSLYRIGKHDEAAKELTVLAGLRDFDFAAETALLLGQCRMAQGEYAAAAEPLANLLASQPKHALAPDAAALLVEALYQEKKYAAVEEKAKSFVESWPSSPARERVMLLRGLGLMAQSQWPAAAERISELLRCKPAGPIGEQAELLLAQCHEQRGADDEALRCYQAVAARQDGKYVPDALLALAGMALRDKPREVAALLDRLPTSAADGPQQCRADLLRARAALALDQPDEALKLLRDRAGHCRESADQFAWWLAKAELRKGEYAQAAKSLERSIRKYPRSALLAEMRYDRAVALAQKGDDDAAVIAAEEFIARHPKHELEPEALYLLATIEHRRRKYDRSAEHCRGLLERYPRHLRAAAAEFLSAENLLLDGSAAAAAKAYQEFIANRPQDPQAASASFRLGAALYRLGRFDEATAPLTRAAELTDREPRLRESLLLLGDLCLQRGEWKNAETWLAKYLATADPPAADEALLKLGLARSRQDQPEAALKAFDELLEKHPKSPHVLHAVFERGQALLALGRTAEASTAFERVLAADAEGRFRPYALKHLGAIAWEKKDFAAAAWRFADAADGAPDDAAATALAQQGQALFAAEQYPEAEKALTKFLERFPGHEQAATIRARLALTLARQNKTADALRAIEQVERSATPPDGELRNGLRYEKAWCLRKLGKLDQAAATYRALLSEKSGTQRGYAALELAELLATSGKCDEALRLLQPLRSSSEDFASLTDDARARVLYRLGVCAFERGNNEEALAALEQLLKDAPRNAFAGSACFFCGEACSRLRRFAQAAEYYNRVIDEHPQDESYAPSLLRLGESLAALERWPRSEEVFALYLREFPAGEQWYQAQFGVGWARENLGRHDEAVAAYRPVVERHRGPTAARAQFQIGECLFAGKKYEEAVAELLKVEILYDYPEWSAGAVYEAGRCFEELNKTAEAKKQFEAVRDKYGQTRWAELASRKIAASAPSGLPGHKG